MGDFGEFGGLGPPMEICQRRVCNVSFHKVIFIQRVLLGRASLVKHQSSEWRPGNLGSKSLVCSWRDRCGTRGCTTRSLCRSSRRWWKDSPKTSDPALTPDSAECSPSSRRSSCSSSSSSLGELELSILMFHQALLFRKLFYHSDSIAATSFIVYPPLSIFISGSVTNSFGSPKVLGDLCPDR